MILGVEIVNWCKTVQEIPFYKAGNRLMSTKVTEGHQKWCYLIGDTSLPTSGLY